MMIILTPATVLDRRFHKTGTPLGTTDYYLDTAPGHALHPRPLKDGTYVLPDETLADPAHAEVHADLAVLPQREVSEDEYLFTGAPLNSVSPSLTFTTASPGKAVSCIAGTWEGVPSPTYKYQWQADGVDINQAITSVHTVTLLDVGKVLTCVVTATNDKGSASAVSNECNAISKAVAARTRRKR